MEPVEFDGDWSQPGGRARRGIALICASLMALTVAGIAFLYPALLTPSTGAPVKQTAYRVLAADFVDRNTGWIVAFLPSGDYAILHTTDGARSWTRLLSVVGESRPIFTRFFDRSTGVFALIGTSPVLRRTLDGGRTWSARPALGATYIVDSWSFVDPNRGWMLAHDAAQSRASPTRLYRTLDGGMTWSDLGSAVKSPDRAFQVHFSSPSTGWLTVSGAGGYAYQSNDAGVTWSRLELPPPVGGWPRTGEFLVAVQPTFGGGAVATVVYFPPLKGRTGIGGNIRAFPPLAVRSFDGGRPHTYLYATLIDQLAGGPWTQEQAPNQVELSTVDNGASWKIIAPPSPSGAIGFFDASNWWWLTAGQSSKSRDGGATWSDPKEAGVVAPQPGTLRVLDRNHAWFAGSGDRRPVIEGTDDGGLSWRLLRLPAIEDVPTP
jgi:photosystem II stability/assembly factor-like uncharacterized protein